MSRVSQIKELGSYISGTIKIECSTCNNKYTLPYEIEDGNDMDKVKEKLLSKSYEEGWRVSQSSVFSHINIHCPSCHVNRNDKNYFKD